MPFIIIFILFLIFNIPFDFKKIDFILYENFLFLLRKSMECVSKINNVEIDVFYYLDIKYLPEIINYLGSKYVKHKIQNFKNVHFLIILRHYF